MKWSELRKMVEEKGWYLQRHGSKHDVYRHPDKNYHIEIERHNSKEVATGLLYRIKKQAGL
ncbi:MAG: type II toxin-antitoxin system HicA family toxin [Prevotellaceae bacterium]|jgi:predicted RNA binding protein YcfA (HicA-like mRNA interferase family)|nr:type II toxin-antitoxin system HicA family toxin [Prevotellaceae bacterium]